jgi:hypothetical protein
MKKFLVFLLLLSLMSCTAYKVVTVYEMEYESLLYSEMLADVYNHLHLFKADSIPIDQWLTFQEYTKKGHKIERVYRKRINDDTQVLFSIDSYVDNSIRHVFSIKIRSRDRRFVR